MGLGIGVRATVWAIALAVVAQSFGCATAGRRLWPKSTRTHEFERAIPVYVTSYPAGATIIVDGAEVSGQTPSTIDVSHTLRRTYQKERRIGQYLGCGAEVGMFAAAVGTVESGDGPYLVVGSLTLLLLDCVGWLVFTQLTQPERVIHDEIVPRSVRVEARWSDAPPVDATLTVPEGKAITLVQDRAKSFDEALLRWASETDRALDADTLYLVGQAMARLAIDTGQQPHADRAREYLQRYLETDDLPQARRQEVDALILKLAGK